ncbi:MAG: hypothetical protein QM715_14945 [Nibricoccus sp.]
MTQGMHEFVQKDTFDTIVVGKKKAHGARKDESEGGTQESQERKSIFWNEWTGCLEARKFRRYFRVPYSKEKAEGLSLRLRKRAGSKE